VVVALIDGNHWLLCAITLSDSEDLNTLFLFFFAFSSPVCRHPKFQLGITIVSTPTDNCSELYRHFIFVAHYILPYRHDFLMK
jgi:hypothetical protein